RPEQRPCRNGAARGHPAPLVQQTERPDRKLLQEEDCGRIGSDEAHHLGEVRVSLRRTRVSVEDVPGADEQRVYCKQPCASSSPIRLRSRRRTTTSSPRRWRERAIASSW